LEHQKQTKKKKIIKKNKKIKKNIIDKAALEAALTELR
jgi:hypothetical protein